VALLLNGSSFLFKTHLANAKDAREEKQTIMQPIRIVKTRENAKSPGRCWGSRFWTAISRKLRVDSRCCCLQRAEPGRFGKLSGAIFLAAVFSDQSVSGFPQAWVIRSRSNAPEQSRCYCSPFISCRFFLRLLIFLVTAVCRLLVVAHMKVKNDGVSGDCLVMWVPGLIRDAL